MSAVAALSDDLRSRMYGYIRRAGRPVTREEAAHAVGISRKLAAFHLDKLVDVGMLTASTATASQPGRVGRAPKVYEPTNRDVSVTIPPRALDTIGAILVDAIASQKADETAEDARNRVAREHGRRLAVGGHPPLRGRLGPERALTVTERTLDDFGYEPYRPEPQCLRLRNCPFHPITERAPALVCGINEAFLTGILEGLGAECLLAALRPLPDECCVQIGRRTQSFH